MLAEDVSWVVIAWKVVDTNDLSGNGFVDPMEGKSIVMFMELGVWDNGAVDNSLIVSENVALHVDQNTEVVKGIMKIDDLVNTCATGDELRTIRSSLNRRLFLRVPIDGSLVK